MVRLAELLESKPEGPGKGGERRAASREEETESVAAVLAAARALSHRLTARVGESYRADRSVAWRVGILRAIERRGSTPVRDLPRRWPVTRRAQGVLVDRLLEEGLVAYEGSPAHRGSRSLRVTHAGREALRRADRLDATLPGGLPDGISRRELEEVARVLRVLGEALG